VILYNNSKKKLVILASSIIFIKILAYCGLYLITIFSLQTFVVGAKLFYGIYNFTNKLFDRQYIDYIKEKK